MHPSKDIVGSRGRRLAGKKVAFGICGSAAVFRAPELARLLMRMGAEVRVVMTEMAARLISPQLLEWATGNEVVCGLTGKIEHVELAQWADTILIAPATANTVGKIAHGIDDTAVTSLASVAIGLHKPVIVVPAMHASMYEHPAVRENLERLRKIGVEIVEPRLEEGKAKFPDPEEVVWRVIRAVTEKDMRGLKVLVTAGPTVEPIDSIKYITNPSSGKMGIAFAKAAAARGADVTLIYGPGTEPVPSGVRTVRVRTTAEMKEAFDSAVREGPDIVVVAAAPQDFVVDHPAEGKLRHDREIVVRLRPAPRVLDGARTSLPSAVLVGFKAEWSVTDEELEAAARRKLEEQDLDIVVANDVSRPGSGFRSERNDVIIVTRSGRRKMAADKEEIAWAVLDLALGELRLKRG